jgi:type II secretory pathway pseudopilin PulG
MGNAAVIRSRTIPRTRQRGIALLVLIVAAGVLAVVMVSNVLVSQQIDQDREARTREALTKAKEALIAYAVGGMDDDYWGSPDVAGHLPCPGVTLNAPGFTEGNQMPNCGAANLTVVGPLPWRSLDIAPVQDGSSECLWYAVSGRFKNNPRGGEPFNWDTEGQIRVLAADGSIIVDKVAAVIIAPGPALDQTRGVVANAITCPGSYVATDYLEAHHGASNHTMVANESALEPALSIVIEGGIDSAAGREVVNDRIAAITPAEIFEAARRRSDFDVRSTSASNVATGLRNLTKVVAQCLAGYYASIGSVPDHRMPWAARRDQTSVSVTPLLPPGLPIETLVSMDDLLAGRAPSALPGGSDPAYLTSSACASAFNPMRAWWNQWHDHLFYAVGPDFTPSASTNGFCDNLGTNRCLKIGGQEFAAIVLFAGRRLAHQSRPQWSAANPTPQVARLAYENYLEGANLANIAAAPMWTALPPMTSSAYTYRQDQIPTAALDDFAFCVKIPSATTTTPIIDACP